MHNCTHGNLPRSINRVVGEILGLIILIRFASEYAGLFAFQSWTRLLLAHLFDRRYRVEHYVGFGAVLGGSRVPGVDVPSNRGISAVR